MSTPNVNSFVDANKTGDFICFGHPLAYWNGSYAFADKIAFTEIETLFLGVGVSGTPDTDYDYVGYELGNDFLGIFQGFLSLRQRYLFDGFQIWLATFNGSLYATKFFICPAMGMQFIAISSNEAFFLSAFDNSLYSFNGGRSVNKVLRMNQEDTILNSVYNEHDSTLLMNCTNNFVWIRDGIASKNTKKAKPTGIALFDTQTGIAICNNTLSWRYSFFALAGSAVATLIWQSGYFGVTENKLGIFSAFVLTLYRADKIASSVIVTFDGFDTDGEWHEEVPYNVKPGDWTPPRILSPPRHAAAHTRVGAFGWNQDFGLCRVE